MDPGPDEPDLAVDIRAELQRQDDEAAIEDGQVPNAPDAEAPVVELTLQERRLHVLEQYRADFIRHARTMRGPEIVLRPPDVVALWAFQNQLRVPFLQAITRLNTPKLEICSHPPLDNHVVSYGDVLYIELAQVIHTVARWIENICPIQHLSIEYDILAPSVLAAFRGIVSLSITTFLEEGPFWQQACNELQHHPTLREIKALEVTPDQFISIGSVLPTIPNLTSCYLNGNDGIVDEDANNDSLIVSRPAAEILSHLFLSLSLVDLTLYNFKFDNRETAEVFLNGIQASHLQKLYLQYISFHPDMNLDVVNAIVTAPALTFFGCATASHVDGILGVDFLGLLTPQLHRSRTLRALTLYGYFDSVDVAMWLRSCAGWNPDDLDIHLRDWHPDLGEIIVEYVETKGLQKLSITLPWRRRNGSMEDDQLPESFVTQIIDAADTGTRALEEFIVNDRDAATWCPALSAILALNRQRRLHGKKFDKIAEAKTDNARKQCLVIALDAIDLVTLNTFLRRNEWRLQELIKNDGKCLHDAAPASDTLPLPWTTTLSNIAIECYLLGDEAMQATTAQSWSFATSLINSASPDQRSFSNFLASQEICCPCDLRSELRQLWNTGANGRYKQLCIILGLPKYSAEGSVYDALYQLCVMYGIPSRALKVYAENPVMQLLEEHLLGRDPSGTGDSSMFCRRFSVELFKKHRVAFGLSPDASVVPSDSFPAHVQRFLNETRRLDLLFRLSDFDPESRLSAEDAWVRLCLEPVRAVRARIDGQALPLLKAKRARIDPVFLAAVEAAAIDEVANRADAPVPADSLDSDVDVAASRRPGITDELRD